MVTETSSSNYMTHLRTTSTFVSCLNTWPVKTCFGCCKMSIISSWASKRQAEGECGWPFTARRFWLHLAHFTRTTLYTVIWNLIISWSTTKATSNWSILGFQSRWVRITTHEPTPIVALLATLHQKLSLDRVIPTQRIFGVLGLWLLNYFQGKLKESNNII